MSSAQWGRVVICAVAALAASVPAVGQEFRATVKGVVVDTSQAALPGATVTVQNQETNEMATATTNEQGNFTIPFLRPGLYTMTVEMTGFQKYTRTDMRLSVGETANINAQLGVSLTETVSVVSESPLLDSSRADRGTVIDSARIAELQTPSGYWPPSLLEPEGAPPETSGTGFFVFGLAWGVNNGLLDPTRYSPAIERGWTALSRAVHPDGKLGWVQQVGSGPDDVASDMTQLYGVGAFLLAGAEVRRMRASDKPAR